MSEDFKKGMAWMRQRGEEIRRSRMWVANKYLDYVKGGDTPDQARTRVIEAFEVAFSKKLSDRQLDHILERSVSLPPGAAVDIVVRMGRICDQAEEDATLVKQHADDMLLQIDALEDAGEDWYEVKNEYGQTGKGPIDKTERVPLDEARRRIIDWRAERLKRQADILKAFKADVQVNLTNYSQYDPAELDKKIEELEKVVKGEKKNE